MKKLFATVVTFAFLSASFFVLISPMWLLGRLVDSTMTAYLGSFWFVLNILIGITYGYFVVGRIMRPLVEKFVDFMMSRGFYPLGFEEPSEKTYTKFRVHHVDYMAEDRARQAQVDNDLNDFDRRFKEDRSRS